jgi:hypothetical protein
MHVPIFRCDEESSFCILKFGEKLGTKRDHKSNLDNEWRKAPTFLSVGLRKRGHQDSRLDAEREMHCYFWSPPYFLWWSLLPSDNFAVSLVMNRCTTVDAERASSDLFICTSLGSVQILQTSKNFIKFLVTSNL